MTFLFRAIILFAAIGNILLGVIVLKRDYKSLVNITFFLMALTTGIWVLANFVMVLYPTPFWIRSTYATGSLAMFTYPTWAYTFCRKEIKRIFLFYIPSIILFIFALTPLVIKSVNSFDVVSMDLEYGPIFVIWSLAIIAAFISLIAILFLSLKKTSGIKRNQVLFVLLGVFIFGFFCVTVSTILPIFGINSFINLDAPSSIFFVAFTTYAIVKHRLMDIRLIIVKSIFYSFLVGSLAVLYILAIAYISNPLVDILGISSNATFVFSGILIAFGFPYIKVYLSKVTDKWFYKKRYNPDELQKEIAEVTNSALDIDDLLEALTKLLFVKMKILKVAIVAERDRFSGIGFSSKPLKFRQLSEIIAKKDSVTIDELKKEDPVREALKKKDINTIVSLPIENKPIGFLVLGPQKSGDYYTAEDLNFLILISHQIAIAVKNTQYYQKIIDDKRRIEKFLEEQKKLDKLKNEFIAITTHEINTPLAATEGYLDLVLSGKAGRINKKIGVYLDKAYQSSRKTYALLKEMMEASKLEQGELPINIESVKVEDSVTEIIKKYSPQAKEKGIVLVSHLPKKIPLLVADPRFLKEIIDELVENAIKFTKKGCVIVSAKSENEEIHTSVADTGRGIPKEHIPHIFDKFYQADASYTREVGGTGLGLYVVKLLLKLQKGRINVSSKLGKGSKFTVILPVAQNKKIKEKIKKD